MYKNKKPSAFKVFFNTFFTSIYPVRSETIANMKLKHFNLLLPAMSSVVMFLIICIFSVPSVSFAALMPFLISIFRCSKFKDFLKSSAVFFFVYYSLSFSFLFRLYEILDISKALGIILSILSVILLSLITSIIHILPTLVFFRFSKGRIVDCFCYSLLFTLGEYLVSIIPILGFPIATVSLSVCGLSSFLQISSLFGSLFITFIIVLINGLFACALITRIISLKSLTSVLLAFLIFLSNIIYGTIRLNMPQDADGGTLTAAAVQIDKSGLEKWKVTSPLSLYKKEISKIGDVDMIFLPETAITTSIESKGVEYSINRIVNSTNAELLTGIFYKNDGKSYNAYCSFANDKTNTYLKSILVPFGEFSFFSDTLFDGTKSLSSADKIQPLKAENALVCVGICIESIYPTIIRKQVKSGGEVIAVPTNDSWFPDTFLQKLHFRHSILRSVENNRYLVRSANSGISAIISPKGEVISSISEGKTGYVKAEISKITKNTFYTKTGNLWIIISFLVYVYMLFINFKQTCRIRFFKLDF